MKKKAQLVGASFIAMVGFLAAAAPALSAAERQKRVLIFSHTTGYRHASIEPGVAALRKLAAARNIAVQASENPDMFRPDALARFDAIIFLSNTTDPKKPESEWLTGSRREALQRFVRRGGGVVGIHAATDSHYGWPWYGRLMGGRFASHPSGTPVGALKVTDSTHPTTKGLPSTVRRADEWYYFDDYNPEAKLLISLDPQSIGQADVNPNPVSWAHKFDNARVFYTAMGHTTESYSDPYFLRHVGNGLDWVLAE
jgi:type 1 glutamine amidotransferase